MSYIEDNHEDEVYENYLKKQSKMKNPNQEPCAVVALNTENNPNCLYYLDLS